MDIVYKKYKNVFRFFFFLINSKIICSWTQIIKRGLKRLLNRKDFKILRFWMFTQRNIRIKKSGVNSLWGI